MHDADALEAINSEQLATATDRLLLRGGRFSRHSFARGVRHQRRRYAITASVRTPVNRPLFAIGIAIPVIVGVGLAVAALR